MSESELLVQCQLLVREPIARHCRHASRDRLHVFVHCNCLCLQCVCPLHVFVHREEATETKKKSAKKLAKHDSLESADYPSLPVPDGYEVVCAKCEKVMIDHGCAGCGRMCWKFIHKKESLNDEKA